MPGYYNEQINTSVSNGETIATFDPGNNYKFILQVPTSNSPDPQAVATSGSLLNGAWHYDVSFDKVEQMPTISTPGSSTSFYYVFLNVTLTSDPSNPQSLVLDASLSPAHLSLPNLVYLTDILIGLNYVTSVGNMFFVEIQPWYVQLNNWIQSVMQGISNWFANFRQSLDQSSENTRDWLNVHLGPALSGVSDVLTTIWTILYAIGYFIVMAWPLWLVIAIIVLVVEVKKWTTSKKEVVQIKRLTVVEQARQEQLKQRHRMEEEHQKRMHEAEEAHLKRVKRITSKRTGKKRKSQPAARPKIEFE